MCRCLAEGVELLHRDSQLGGVLASERGECLFEQVTPGVDRLWCAGGCIEEVNDLENRHQCRKAGDLRRFHMRQGYDSTEHRFWSALRDHSTKQHAFEAEPP